MAKSKKHLPAVAAGFLSLSAHILPLDYILKGKNAPKTILRKTNMLYFQGVITIEPSRRRQQGSGLPVLLLLCSAQHTVLQIWIPRHVAYMLFVFAQS